MKKFITFACAVLTLAACSNQPADLDSVKWLPADEEIINELKH